MTKTLYQCPECRLHYTDQATAKHCEAWCKEHQSCNLEVTKLSVERQTKEQEGRQGDA